MSAHWRLATRYALAVAVLAAIVAGWILLRHGGAYAGAFVYGVGIGTASFVSTALTVSLLTGCSAAGGMAVGSVSFAGRCLFAAGALGMPAYLGSWPVIPMLAGFAGVYLAENMVLLPGVLGVMSGRSVRRGSDRSLEHPAHEREERRVEA